MDSDACRAEPSFARSSKNMMLSKGECVCVCVWSDKTWFCKASSKAPARAWTSRGFRSWRVCEMMTAPRPGIPQSNPVLTDEDCSLPCPGFLMDGLLPVLGAPSYVLILSRKKTNKIPYFYIWSYGMIAELQSKKTINLSTCADRSSK